MSLVSTDNLGASNTTPRPRWGEARTTRRRLWSISVLIVEDDAADTSLILNVLRRHPSVSSAQAVDTPDVALRQLSTGALRPDLVLLDVHMPRIDGFEFLTALRRIPAMADIPVAFLTTSALAKDVAGAKCSSALTYIVKPDTFAELQKRLDVVIRRVTAGG